ncbi:hypothetical protein Trydic_g8473 [Trypoxylus dichotomus]
MKRFLESFWCEYIFRKELPIYKKVISKIQMWYILQTLSSKTQEIVKLGGADAQIENEVIACCYDSM